MAQKLVYTSSPKGLQPGAYGFCVVAATRGLHDRVASFLASTSGYRRVFSPESGQANLNPVSHTHMLVDNLGQTFRILSRVADAGLDYTNRTNKIASFLLPDRNELVPAGPAALFDVPGLFYTSWNQAPTWFEPTPIPAAPEPASTLCSEWARVMGAPDWGAALAATVYSGAPVALVYEPGRNVDVLKMFQESIHLLPVNMRWNATFSTYFTQAPLGAQCQWKAVLAGSPEEATMRANQRVVIFDLTRPGGAMPDVGLASPDGAQLLNLARGVAPMATPTAVPVPGGVPFGSNVPSVANAMPGNAFPPAPQPQGGAAFPPPITKGAPFDGSGSSDIYGIQQFPGGTKPLNYGRDWVQPEDDALVGQRRRKGNKSGFGRFFWGSVILAALLLAVGIYLYQNTNTESKEQDQNEIVSRKGPGETTVADKHGSDSPKEENEGALNLTDEEKEDSEGLINSFINGVGLETESSEINGENSDSMFGGWGVEEKDNTSYEDVASSSVKVVTQESLSEQDADSPSVLTEEHQDSLTSESQIEPTFEPVDPVNEDEENLKTLFNETFNSQSNMVFVNGKGEPKLTDVETLEDNPVYNIYPGILLLDSSGSLYNLNQFLTDGETEEMSNFEVVIIAYGEGSNLPKKTSVKPDDQWTQGGDEYSAYRMFTTHPHLLDINVGKEIFEDSLSFAMLKPDAVPRSFREFTCCMTRSNHNWLGIFFNNEQTRDYFRRSARIQFGIKGTDLKSKKAFPLIPPELLDFSISDRNKQKSILEAYGIRSVLVIDNHGKKIQDGIPPQVGIKFNLDKTRNSLLSEKESSNDDNISSEYKLESVELIELNKVKDSKSEGKSTSAKHYQCKVQLNYLKNQPSKTSLSRINIAVTARFSLNALKGNDVKVTWEDIEFESDNYMDLSEVESFIDDEFGEAKENKGLFFDIFLVSNANQKEDEWLDLGSFCIACRKRAVPKKN